MSVERLTKRDENGFLNHPWEFNGVNGSYDIWDEELLTQQIDRLAAYEDTGLEPEQVIHAKLALMGKVIAEVKEFDGIPIDHLRELAQAEKDGRLVVLDEPRKPLVWGNDDHDSILCPRCGHDLMGGFPEGDSCETPMYQCPYCGQPIDGTRALTSEEAEAAMKGGADRA